MCEEYYRDQMSRERYSEKNHAKEQKAYDDFREKCREQGAEFDSDNDSLPDVSSASDFYEDTDFEEEVNKIAYAKYNAHRKTLKAAKEATMLSRADSSGSMSATPGKYDLC
jgi:primase-polymerase (primpol)-like protein